MPKKTQTTPKSRPQDHGRPPFNPADKKSDGQTKRGGTKK